jgi:hypothetical protein
MNVGVLCPRPDLVDESQTRPCGLERASQSSLRQAMLEDSGGWSRSHRSITQVNDISGHTSRRRNTDHILQPPSRRVKSRLLEGASSIS